ncbi:hypothetical protein K788_0000612 [Paraburkholderia caribensis MBA4]|uniref:Uncharacterized protein n=1 Tax=Paraburkholderia caribensis MBA4 TaxID=1323664 RepID=A0A0P0RHU8_9BURK|nr:hypothetical protein K788_0000612 [Paraburkholderia caribensis MBA4]
MAKLEVGPRWTPRSGDIENLNGEVLPGGTDEAVFQGV